MALLDAERVTALADQAGFQLVERRTKRLANGKCLASSIFESSTDPA